MDKQDFHGVILKDEMFNVYRIFVKLSDNKKDSYLTCSLEYNDFNKNIQDAHLINTSRIYEVDEITCMINNNQFKEINQKEFSQLVKFLNEIHPNKIYCFEAIEEFKTI